MSSYINVGAFVNGERPRTKKALKEALATNPASVAFDSTTAIGPEVGKTYAPVDLAEGVKLTVTGPDPYTKRTWFATVERTDKGVKVTV